MYGQTKNMVQDVCDRFEAGVNMIWDDCVIPGAVAIYDKFLAKFMHYDETEEKHSRQMVLWSIVLGLV